MAAQQGLRFPHIEQEETGVIVGAVMELEDEGLVDMFMWLFTTFDEEETTHRNYRSFSATVGKNFCSDFPSRQTWANADKRSE